MHPVRLSTLFLELPSAFNGSAAPPLHPGQEANGCFNDASTWTPSGAAGAAGPRRLKKWRGTPNASFQALSLLSGPFLPSPPPRPTFFVSRAYGMASSRYQLRLRRATRAELEVDVVGESACRRTLCRSLRGCQGQRGSWSPLLGASMVGDAGFCLLWVFSARRAERLANCVCNKPQR